MPVLNVEWTGDMSAPSILAQRLPSSSPEIDVPNGMKQESKETDSDEQNETVKRTHLSSKRARKNMSINTRPNLFSDIPAQETSPPRLEDKVNVSKVAVNRTQQQIGKRRMTRPRISTKTFRPPLRAVGEVVRTNPPELTKSFAPEGRPKCNDDEELPTPKPWPGSRRSFRHSQSSLSSSESDFDGNKFFTPRSRRKQTVYRDTLQHDSISKELFSLINYSSPSSVYSRAMSQIASNALDDMSNDLDDNALQSIASRQSPPATKNRAFSSDSQLMSSVYSRSLSSSTKPKDKIRRPKVESSAAVTQAAQYQAIISPPVSPGPIILPTSPTSPIPQPSSPSPHSQLPPISSLSHHFPSTIYSRPNPSQFNRATHAIVAETDGSNATKTKREPVARATRYYTRSSNSN